MIFFASVTTPKRPDKVSVAFLPMKVNAGTSLMLFQFWHANSQFKQTLRFFCRLVLKSLFNELTAVKLREVYSSSEFLVNIANLNSYVLSTTRKEELWFLNTFRLLLCIYVYHLVSPSAESCLRRLSFLIERQSDQIPFRVPLPKFEFQDPLFCMNHYLFFNVKLI